MTPSTCAITSIISGCCGAAPKNHCRYCSGPLCVWISVPTTHRWPHSGASGLRQVVSTSA